MKKQVLSVLLCVAMVVGMLPAMETTVAAENTPLTDDEIVKILGKDNTDGIDGYIKKIDDYRKANGWTYICWNKYGTDDATTDLLLSDLANKDYTSCTDGQCCIDDLGGTERKAWHDAHYYHSNTFYSEWKSLCHSNKFAGDYQCSGFADYIEYLLFSQYTSNTDYYSKETSVPNDFTFHPGDLIRYDGHTVVVYNIIGETLCLLDCNYTYACRIRWDRTMTASEARNYINKVDTDEGIYQSTNYIIIPKESLRNNDTHNIPSTTCTVTFNPGDGTVATTSKIVTVGEAYGELPTPTRDGYTFLGWGSAADSTTYTTAETTVTNSENHTLYAVWKENGICTVTFNANGGAVGTASKTVKTGEAYGTLPVPTRDNYMFLGWAASNDSEQYFTETSVVTATEDHTLYAIWEEPILGSGTSSDPYVITRATHLAFVKANPSAYYILGNDIDCTGKQIAPIGTEDAPFTGSFDGEGYTISNLSFDLPDEKYVGLFGLLNGTATNVKLANVSIAGGQYVAGVAGSALSNSMITNCAVLSGVVRSLMASSSEPAYVGGITANCEGVISNCSNNAALNSGNYIGGIVGYYNSQVELIENCSNTGTVNANGPTYKRNADFFCGGIVGYSNSAIKLTNANNHGVITSNKIKQNNLTSVAGGIIGYITSSASSFTQNCTNYGNISALDACGGIVGVSSESAEIKLCSNYGDISSVNNSTLYSGGYAGGIVGYTYVRSAGGLTDVTISECVNSGAVSSTSDYATYFSNSTICASGGIVGCAVRGVTVKMCKNVGHIFSAATHGGYSHCCASGIVSFRESTDTTVLNCINYGDIYQQDRTGESLGSAISDTDYRYYVPERIENCINLGNAIVERTVEVNISSYPLTASGNFGYGRLNISPAGITLNNASVYCDELGQHITSSKGYSLSELKNSGSGAYAGWDFTNSWTQNEAVNSGLPQPNGYSVEYMNQSALLLNIGGNGTLSAPFAVSRWETSDSSVATCENGSVTANGVGTACISAWSEDNLHRSNCIVYVYGEVNSLALSENSTSVIVDSSITLSTDLPASDPQGIIWSTSDSNVASVSSDGTVIGKTLGNATITARLPLSNVEATCAVRVVNSAGQGVYSVSFDSNSGSGTMPSQTILENTQAPLAENTFTREGYTFNGWNTLANGTGTAYVDKGNITLTDNTTLYAQWTPITYTISFAPNATEGISGTMTSQQFTYDESQNLTACSFTRAGYTFSGWNTAADGSGTEITDAQSIENLTINDDESVTLYAQWSSKPTPNLSVSITGWTYGAYDGAVNTPSVTGNSGGGAETIEYKLKSAADNAYSETLPTATGEYTVRATVAETDNFNSGTATADFTISKKPVTIIGLSAKNKEYDGTTTATVIGTVEIDGKVGEDDVSISAGSAAFADANVGTGKAVTFSGYSLTGTAAGNYTLSAQPTSVTADITAKSITGATVTLSAAQLEFTGSEQSVSVTSVKLGDTTLTTDDYDVSGDLTGTAKNTYTVTVTGKGNYTGSATATWAITDKPMTVSAPDMTATYNGQAHGITVSVSDPASGYTIKYGNAEGTYDLDASPTITNAGDSGKVVYFQVTADNYKTYTGFATITINKAPLTITAKPKTITYGDAPANDGVSYSGFVSGETSAILSGSLEYTYSYSQFGDAGSYAITPSGLTSDNYAISFVAGTLTVEKKEVGIEWSTAPLTFTGSAQAPTATATGTVNGDEIGVTVSGAQTDAGTGYTATASGLAGDKAGNYKLPDVNTTTFSIGKAAAQSPAPVALNKAAGTSSITASVSGAMPANARTLIYSKGAASATGSSSVSSWSVDANGTITASVYTVAADTITLPVIIESTNYENSTVSVVVTIVDKSDAGVTITGDNNKTYGDAAYTLTGSVTSAGTGDAWTWTSSNPSVATVTDAGAVTIVGGGTTSITAAYESDTTIGSASLTLTVNPKSVAIPTAASGLKWTGGEQTGVASGEGYSVANGAATAVGSYTATTTLTSTTNYRWSDGSTGTKSIAWSIGKADGPAAPTNLAGVAPTTDGGSDGKITGVTTAMEYSASGTAYTPCSGTEITGLTAGTYYVRVAATATHEAGAAASVNVPAHGAPTTYNVTVVSGTGGGSYAAGATVTIKANNPETGKVFDKWVTSSGVGFADANSATTTFTMPAKTVTVTATYKDAPDTVYSVSGSFDGNGKLIATVTAPKDSVLVAAAYESSGKMADTKSFAITAAMNGGTHTFTDLKTGTGYAYKLMLVDKTSYAPLCAAWGNTKLTVAGGTGSGEYAAEATITITANAAPAGQVFYMWMSDSAIFASAYSATTTLTMPTKNTTVTATYRSTVNPTPSGGGGGDDYTPSTPATPSNTATTNSADGSATKTTTNADGSKTAVTTAQDGSTTTTTTAKDGSATTTEKTADGSTGTVKTDAQGNAVSAEAAPSTRAISEAAAKGKAVTLPVEVKATNDAASAAEVKVTLPETVNAENPTTVEIPVENLTPGTVAVIVNADGTEEIVKTSTTGEDGVVLTLDGSATIKIVDNTKSFNDVTGGEWYANNVAWAASREVMNGVGDGDFAPDATTTSAMVAQILMNLADGSASPDAAAATFNDVAANDWFASAISWVMETGIAQGEGESFGVADAISRERDIVMMYHFAQYMGYDTTARADLSSFTDAGSVSEWAQEAMEWAVGVGLINGTTDTNGNVILNAQGTATRGQIAAITQRFCEKVAK